MSIPSVSNQSKVIEQRKQTEAAERTRAEQTGKTPPGTTPAVTNADRVAASDVTVKDTRTVATAGTEAKQAAVAAKLPQEHPAFEVNQHIETLDRLAANQAMGMNQAMGKTLELETSMADLAGRPDQTPAEKTLLAAQQALTKAYEGVGDAAKAHRADLVEARAQLIERCAFMETPGLKSPAMDSAISRSEAAEQSVAAASIALRTETANTVRSLMTEQPAKQQELKALLSRQTLPERANLRDGYAATPVDGVIKGTGLDHVLDAVGVKHDAGFQKVLEAAGLDAPTFFGHQHVLTVKNNDDLWSIGNDAKHADDRPVTLAELTAEKGNAYLLNAKDGRVADGSLVREGDIVTLPAGATHSRSAPPPNETAGQERARVVKERVTVIERNVASAAETLLAEKAITSDQKAELLRGSEASMAVVRAVQAGATPTSVDLPNLVRDIVRWDSLATRATLYRLPPAPDERVAAQLLASHAQLDAKIGTDNRL